MRKVLDFAYCAMWVVILTGILGGIFKCVQGH